MAPVSEKLTPMMQQYRELKEQHKDCFLFFRLGDFYEMFFEDAAEASRLLNLTLTKRQSTPMCGVPHHAAESYIGRLTRLGRKVAICEQLSDPSLPGIVKRDVIRVITPGTTFDERILEGKTNRFAVAVIFGRNGQSGLAACDVTTGLFHIAALRSLEELREEIFRLRPAECIVDAVEKNLPEFLRKFEEMPVFPHQCWEEPRGFLAKHFGVKDLRGFGIDGDEDEGIGFAVSAAAWLLDYLRQTQKCDLSHIRPPQLLARGDVMILDETAIRNLELFVSLREGKREGSLLSVLDMTKTSMGGRVLRQWILNPLRRRDLIEERLDAVSSLLENFQAAAKGGEILSGVLDMERLLARVSVGTGNARDLLGIALSLKSLEPLAEILKGTKSALFQRLLDELLHLQSLPSLREKILATLMENPPLSVKDGGLVRDGISDELDELRTISTEGKDFIAQLQEKEIARTGIPSLKIRFNNIFGYYIEITKANLPRVPSDYIRKQTMVNAERFITPELKEYEEKVLGAEEKMKALEYEIFLKLREEAQACGREIQDAARIFGIFDVVLSAASAAQRYRYCRPDILDEDEMIEICEGWHPVVAELAGGKFVPNDTALGARDEKAAAPSGDACRIALLTGPNMGGKSTYLRQTALIALLAHVGFFVPARSAKIPLIDRIFTRVGASDNLVRGESTFMVEMQETAQILHYATKNSLIILDEIGRGTSTYDGVSLAWAILEFIHDRVGARTLFATHYHELVAVAERLPRAANFSVAISEKSGEIIFLYRVVRGAASRSYGIEVARLAGLPSEVTDRAKNILIDLEEGVVEKEISRRVKKERRTENQPELFAEHARLHRSIDGTECRRPASACDAALRQDI